MNDAEAKAFADDVLSAYTAKERLFVRVITRGETYYGQGWKDNGDAPGDPKTSNNWGAVQYFGDGDDWFAYTDSHSDGEKYAARFRVYPTPEAGLLDAARTILKPNVRAALASGSGSAAVAAMKANRYFELTLPLYQTAAARNYGAIVTSTGETGLSFSGGGSSDPKGC
jgi:hypothetical protein